MNFQVDWELKFKETDGRTISTDDYSFEIYYPTIDYVVGSGENEKDVVVNDAYYNPTDADILKLFGKTLNDTESWSTEDWHRFFETTLSVPENREKIYAEFESAAADAKYDIDAEHGAEAADRSREFWDELKADEERDIQ